MPPVNGYPETRRRLGQEQDKINRNVVRDVKKGRDVFRADSQYNVRPKLEQLCSVLENAFRIASPKAHIEPQIATVLPAELLKLLTKRGKIGFWFQIASGDTLDWPTN